MKKQEQPTPVVSVRLSEATIELRDRAREFAEREVKPIAKARDLIPDPAQAFPWDVWRKASREGWRTMALPRDEGGSGIDILTHCVLVEEFTASGDVSFAAGMHQVWKTQELLLTSEYLRHEVLPRFLADDDFMFSLSFTEPDAGTDNMLPYDGADGGSRTTAVRQPDGDWVINGTKHFLTGAGISKGSFVLTRTDPSKGMSDGATVFYVDHSLPGFSAEYVHSKLGMRNIPNGRLRYDNVRVPDDARVSPVGKGIAFIGSFGIPYAPTTSGFAIGVARQALESTLDWCKNRWAGGRPLIEHQAVATILGDMYADIELARTMMWNAAWSGQNDPHHDVKLGIISQLFSAEMVVRVCCNAMRIWGGRGYMKEFPIEKLLRDALFNAHVDGTNDINRLRITRSLTGGTGGYLG